MRKDYTSPDGYIIAQSKTDDLPYGGAPSSLSGCGWIAAYNYIKALGGTASADAVRTAMGATSPFNGWMGTGPLRLRRFLQRRGYATEAAFGRKNASRLAQNAAAGILMYRSQGPELHFVCFARQPDGTLRFFNAVDGAADHRLPDFDAFLNEYVRFSPVYLMAAPAERTPHGTHRHHPD